MSSTLLIERAMTTAIVWPERREIPCRDLDLDCFAFDGVVPFGGYKRCQEYASELGRCIFLHDRADQVSTDRSSLE